LGALLGGRGRAVSGADDETLGRGGPPARGARTLGADARIAGAGRWPTL